MYGGGGGNRTHVQNNTLLGISKLSRQISLDAQKPCRPASVPHGCFILAVGNTAHHLQSRLQNGVQPSVGASH